MAIATDIALDTMTEAFNARDLDTIAEVLAHDVVLRAPGFDGEGRDACLEFYVRWLDDFEDARLVPHHAHVLDDVIVEEGIFTGKHCGAAATGRSVAIEYVQVLRTRDDKYSAVTVRFDRLQVLEQLGLLPE
jgi:hypothetical protein